MLILELMKIFKFDVTIEKFIKLFESSKKLKYRYISFPKYVSIYKNKYKNIIINLKIVIYNIQIIL